jgi:hypothetical protein
MSPAVPESSSFQQDLVSPNRNRGYGTGVAVCVQLCLLDKLGEVVSEGGMCVVDCGFDGYLVLEGVEENELVALEWMSLWLSS